MAAASPAVIDWDEAMQQCGEDEEFLRELLADLRSEMDTQVAKITETINVRCEPLIFFDVTSKRPTPKQKSLPINRKQHAKNIVSVEVCVFVFLCM